MGVSTFSGPLRVGRREATVGVVPAVRMLDLVPLAQANTDLTLALPKCRILRFSVQTRTAFTGTTVVLNLGTAAGGAQLVSAANIKAAGVVDGLTIVGDGVPSLFEFTGGTLFARIVQTAPETAVGLATLIVEYLPLDEALAA